jgi:hypothetical protein
MKPVIVFAVLISTLSAQSPLPVPGAGNVTLSLDEYNKLVELASQPPRKNDVPPVASAIRSAELSLVVGSSTVTGRVALDGEVFAKGDRKVPLVSGMIVTDAQQQGKPLPLELEGSAHVAVLPGASEFSATLDVGLPLNIEPGRASFNLPVPAAGTARLSLSIPGEQTQVTLNPGLITSRSSANGRTTIEATLVPGQNANIGWASRLAPPPAAPKEVRFLSDVKTLVSVTEAELGITALAEVTVLQGDPDLFKLEVPEGYELTTATGPTLESSDIEGKTVLLRVTSPQARSHQFLISFGRANMTPKADVPLITFVGTQRETGEVLIEGEGAIELKATEHGGLRRMDLKEANAYLQSLARSSPESAFRYQKKAGEIPSLGLEWVRFPDSSVLSAVAQRAVVTTLVTSEGRSLTEVRLTLKNRSQPFLKVGLPAGATILSAEVGGEKVKPVEGSDGNRVPLLRPGFRPPDLYSMSFVFLHAGSPFAKKGGAELALPKMDIPVSFLEWEVFLPSRYTVADFGGDAISARLLPAASDEELVAEELPPGAGGGGGGYPVLAANVFGLGRLRGAVVDPAGAVVAGSNITVKHLATGQDFKAVTDQNGQWSVQGVPSGRVQVVTAEPGFRSVARELDFDANRGQNLNTTLELGGVSESVTVTAEVSKLQTQASSIAGVRQQAKQAQRDETAASANVADLQRRVSGVLPIAVNVPRTGSAYRFVRPLVMDEETKLTFSYKTK